MTRWQTLGFFLLCLLDSASWLTDGLPASQMMPVAGEGFRLLLVGASGLLAYFWARGSERSPSMGHCALVGAASLGLIGIPYLLLVAAEGKIASTSVVLVFAGMPILLSVVDASSSAGSGLRLLPAGLMGVAGLLTLLPLQVPRGGTGVLGLGLLLLAMGCTAVSLAWLHRLLDGFPFSAALSIAGLTNGVALSLAASASAMPRWHLQDLGIEGLRCLALDFPQVLLLLWLVRFLQPRQLAARYVVAPLMTVLEGLLMLRPGFEVRTLASVLLLGFAAYLMLRSDHVDREIAFSSENELG